MTTIYERPGPRPHVPPSSRPDSPPDRPYRPRRLRTAHLFVAAVSVVVVVICAAIAGAVYVQHVRDSDLHRQYLAADGWPVRGQAAYRVDQTMHVGPAQRPVPIASLAKVMTAYLVLRAHPLRDGSDGFVMTVTPADVRTYDQERASGQSVVGVRAGEAITEREALLALLLPSANNVAHLLATNTAGSAHAFVVQMNRAAAQLGMRDTRYTDPSGYAPTTVSTARDQVVLATVLAHDDVLGDAFGALVSTPSARLPVAGTVRNTDVLVNTDGFVGTKTGSDTAAGGCFMFRSWRVVHGVVRDVVGVVLGQRGRHDITAGQYAARELVDHLGPAASA